MGTTVPALRAIAVLEDLIALHGAARWIRCDNGPELTSLALTAWRESRGIAPRHQARHTVAKRILKPFNRMYRTEIRDAYVFTPVTEVRELTAGWLDRHKATPIVAIG